MHQLNPQQLQAVRFINGPLLVLAGAGSGKTSVITEKVAYLISSCGYKPAQILAVTFTNKAAREMKSRLAQKLSDSKGLVISTFHTLGLNIIKREYKKLGFKANFTLFDESDSITLIHDIAYDAYQATKESARQIKHNISLWKNNLLTPELVKLDSHDKEAKRALEVYHLYQKYLKAYNAVDFDDLILLPTQLLAQDEDVRQNWQHRFRYILIDEYQDTNESQYQLMRQLVGKREQFTVVGDDDQSIYAWRGARVENLHHLKKDYPDLVVIKLEQNYRSTGRILHAANTLIRNNPHLFDKKLWSTHAYGDPIRVIMTKNEDDEAIRIASDIINHKLKNQGHFKHYAVLIRSNHQSYLLERYFQLYKIPYAISGGSSFFAKAEIKDILAYFKLITNLEDDRAFLRIVNTPKREIGAATLERLGHYAQRRHIPLYLAITELGLKHEINESAMTKLLEFHHFIEKCQNAIHKSDDKKMKQTLTEIIESINYRQWLIDNSGSIKQAEKKYQNIFDLIGWICEKPDTEKNEALDFAATINRLLLLDIIDRDKEQKDDEKVQILTVHAAKGLEYPNVYMMGVEDGIIPHQQCIDDGDIEEERRLAYVAITRARLNLTLTLTKRRKRFGESIASTPSRFLDELPEEDLNWTGKTESTPEDRKTSAKSNIAMLKQRFNKE
ncbi:MAG: UvrD-helicase domain-containing protein [Francisellaceae bacterium]